MYKIFNKLFFLFAFSVSFNEIFAKFNDNSYGYSDKYFIEVGYSGLSKFIFDKPAEVIKPDFLFSCRNDWREYDLEKAAKNQFSLNHSFTFSAGCAIFKVRNSTVGVMGSGYLNISEMLSVSINIYYQYLHKFGFIRGFAGSGVYLHPFASGYRERIFNDDNTRNYLAYLNVGYGGSLGLFLKNNAYVALKIEHTYFRKFRKYHRINRKQSETFISIVFGLNYNNVEIYA